MAKRMSPDMTRAACQPWLCSRQRKKVAVDEASQIFFARRKPARCLATVFQLPLRYALRFARRSLANSLGSVPERKPGRMNWISASPW